MRIEDLPPHAREKARQLLAEQRVPAPPHPAAPPSRTVRRCAVGERVDDTLTLRLPVTPRTKKNSARGVAKASAAYARFAFQLRALLREHQEALGLPLPQGAYNVAAWFITDGALADTVGLMQALADALEPDPRSGFVGVVTNDRQLRTWDGTQQRHDPLRSRVEVTITPLPGAR